MFTVTVRDHMMVAHSLAARSSDRRSDCTGRRTSSTRVLAAPTRPDGILVDIGRATVLHEVLGGLTTATSTTSPRWPAPTPRPRCSRG